MEIRTWSRRILRRVRWLYLVAIGLIGAVLTLGERIETLYRSKAWVYSYVLVDMFKVEIAGILGVLLAWDVMQMWTARGSERSLLSRRGRMVAVLGMIPLVGLTAYHGRMYLAGKRIYLHEYPERLVRRAETAFLQGDIWIADLHLGVCRVVFRTPRCEEVHKRLHTRLDRARQLRELYQTLPKGTVPPVRALEASYLLDRNRTFYEEAIHHIEVTEARLKREYSEALKLIADGDIPRAITQLGVIHHEWQGFGDSHILLRELRASRRTSDIDAERAPYLAAIRKYGHEQFIQRTLRTDAPRPLHALKRGTFLSEDN